MDGRRLSLLAALTTGTAAVLPRMRRDFDEAGGFSTGTAALMWTLYAGGTAAYADALARGTSLLPPPRAGAALVAAAGLGTAAAGMGAFDSASQVAGTKPGTLTTTGVYRISRNPQYVGLTIAGLAGAAARRSLTAGAVAASYGAICLWWVRVEERALLRRFGDSYSAFCAATPRWLGWPD